MTIKYLLEKISSNGTKDQTVADFNKDFILIGRGSGCDVRLDSQYVSLQHAKFSLQNEQFSVEDPGSLGSVIVNNSIQKYKILKEGDRVKLSDVQLKVIKLDGCWGLKEIREQKDNIDPDLGVQKSVHLLNIQNRLPSMKFFSIISFIIVFGLYGIYPFITKKQDFWSSGPVSSHHSMISSDCTACHTGNFVRVEDSKCLNCHDMTEHSKVLSDLSLKHSAATPEDRCATCHMEHNSNQGLIVRDQRECISCHADIKKINPESTHPNVASFEKHPEFSVAVQNPNGSGEITKVLLTDTLSLKDNSNVKLNHMIHLKPIRSKDGIVQLNCRDCHTASPDLKTINKINFDKHCRSCHSLGFDERLKGKEVPHAQPDVVYNFLYAEYAKLMLASDDSPQAEETFNRRFKPGQAAPSLQNQPSAKDDFKQEFVEKESRNSERLLFTKTACYLCHRILEKTQESKTADNSASYYEVIKPQIPVDWMPAAKFNHGSHEAVKCDDCHSGVYESTKTNQVLMPKIEKCVTCHVDSNTGNKITNGNNNAKVQSDCISCHSFHDQKLVEFNKKRNINQIIK